MKIKLNKNICIKIIFILLILFSMGINITFSQNIFMPIPEITPGMKGIGKTVFHGTQIETFQVDIIDIVKGEGGISHFILANLSGDKIEEGGGISAGMSGSPVYIDDRLIGAVSYAWEMSEHNLCLVTPIQEMLEIFKFPYDNYQTTAQEYKINNFLCFAGENTSKIIMKNTMENNSFPELTDREEIIFYPVVSPIIINGIKGRTLDRLNSSLKKFNLMTIQGIGFNESNEINFQEVGESPSNKIKAGSAIGIQLTRGDVNITSIGTVTYREGDKILALGHPFLKKGRVSLLLSAIYVYHSLPNMVMPFKLGSPLNLVGKVVQDREAGILAILNSYPRIIPLKIKVTDVNSGLSYQMGVQIINNYDLLEPLVSNITVQAIDNTLDRIGTGIAQVEIEIKGEKGQELLRKNMYYSSDDIALQAITEIPEIIDLIVNNYFEIVDLTAINIDIKIDSKKKIGRIEEVVLEDSSIKSGDYLEAKIKIRPFRGELIEKMLTIQIPSDTLPGEALLMVNGGGELDNQQEESVNSSKQDCKSLEETFQDISDWPRGNQIIGEVIIYSNELPYEENISDGDLRKKEEEDLIISKIETDMVIEGYLEISFTIENELIDQFAD
jgi:hypothetical protein